MAYSTSNIQLKESSSNVFLLLFTLSLVSFFLFGNSRVEAFFITFFSSLLLFTTILYYFFNIKKKSIEQFSNEKKNLIKKLKKYNYEFSNEPIDSNKEKMVWVDTYDKDTSAKIVRDKGFFPTKKAATEMAKMHSFHYKGCWIIGTEIHKMHTRELSHFHNSTVNSLRMLGYNTFESSFPNILSEFGKILNSDNGIESYAYTNEDVNSLILKMNICLNDIRGKWINNQYSKEVTISTIKIAIDYLMEKRQVPSYGSHNPVFTNLK